MLATLLTVIGIWIAFFDTNQDKKKAAMNSSYLSNQHSESASINQTTTSMLSITTNKTNVSNEIKKEPVISNRTILF